MMTKASGVSTSTEVLKRLEDPAVQAFIQMLPGYWRTPSTDSNRNAETV